MVEASAQTAAPSWRRVLVFRSCRTPQFQAAVEQVHQLHPQAEIVALAHPDFAADVLSAGADHVVATKAKRLNVSRVGLVRLLALRRMQFDAVVVPVRTNLATSANLLRLAAAIGAPTVMLVMDDGVTQVVALPVLRQLALVVKMGDAEVWVTLARMAWAVCRRWLVTPPRRSEARLRVLHIINDLALGGAQAQFAELVNRTPPEFDVDVLVLANTGSPASRRLRRDDVPIAYLDGITVHRTATILAAVIEHCRRGRYDVVHTWLPWANMLGAAGARLAGVPRIVTSVRSLNPGHLPHELKWWYRAGDMLAGRIADVMTVNAYPLAADHAEWAMMPASRIVVVHNGLDPASLGEGQRASRAWLRQLIGAPAGAVVIGTVGRLAIEKDQATFIRAVAILRDEGRSFRAVVAGEGPYGEVLRELVRARGLESVVSFLGAEADGRRVIAGLDLFALTSAIEGFPNVILEAGFLGVPVVSSDVGGVADVVGGRDGLFRPGDARAAAAAMHAALGNRGQTAALATRLYDRCLQHFTADRMVERWMAVYGRRSALAVPQSDPRDLRRTA